MRFSALKNTIAIDLGTDFTRIYYKGEIINEPSVVAYDTLSANVIALGTDAYNMIGKNPELITVAKPLSNGVITDFDLACHMVQGFINKYASTLIKPACFITVPCGITDVEKRAICDIIRESDINEIYLIDSPIAGAIGANCDVNLARGMMLIDFGGGKCDIAVISLGQAVISSSLKFAGNDFTEALKKHIELKHGLIIGEQSAEKLKLSIGALCFRDQNTIDEVSGYNTRLRRPEKIAIRQDDAIEAFSPILNKVVSEIKSTLDELPPELLGDIMEDGILLIGGGAQLYGFSKVLRQALNMKVFLAEDAEMCVIRGAGFVANHMDDFDSNTYIYKKG